MGTCKLRKTTLKKRGRKTAEWEQVRRQLKKRFMAAGITECEIRWGNCWRSNGLSWAHGKKRRELMGNELSELVVLGCAPCHTALEGQPREIMLAIVRNIINSRERQP